MKHDLKQSQLGSILPICLGVLMILSLTILSLISWQNSINQIIGKKQARINEKYQSFSISQNILLDILRFPYSRKGVSFGKSYVLLDSILGETKEELFEEDKEVNFGLIFDGRLYKYTYEEKDYFLRFWDAGSLLNYTFNANSGFEKYLQDLGLNEYSSRIMSQRWADFIDSNDSAFLLGAEKQIYLSRGLMKPINQSYRSLFGMKAIFEYEKYFDKEFEKIIHWGVLSSDNYWKLNPNVAPAKLLQIGFKINEVQSQRVIERRKEYPFILREDFNRYVGLSGGGEISTLNFSMTEHLLIQVYKDENDKIPVEQFLTQRLNDAYDLPIIINNYKIPKQANIKLLTMIEKNNVQIIPKLD